MATTGMIQLKDTAKGKGLRTAFQAMGGALVGLVATVWAVPGVPEAVTTYVTQNALSILVMIGIPSGLIAYLQNKNPR